MQQVNTFILFFILTISGCAATSNDTVESNDFNNQSIEQLQSGITAKHPVSYIVLAAKLFKEGAKEDAAEWYYIGQIRYKAYLQANPNLPLDGEPALFASLIDVIGTPINRYIAGDVDLWVTTIDNALIWHASNDDNFIGKEKNKKIYDGIVQGLEDFKEYVISNKETIRQARSANGLENR